MIFNFLVAEQASSALAELAPKAIKTMVLKHLRLINPFDYLCDEARWLACAPNEVNLLHRIGINNEETGRTNLKNSSFDIFQLSTVTFKITLRH